MRAGVSVQGSIVDQQMMNIKESMKTTTESHEITKEENTRKRNRRTTKEKMNKTVDVHTFLNYLGMSPLKFSKGHSV